MLNQARSAFRMLVEKALSRPYRALSTIRNSARRDDDWTVALQAVGSRLETLAGSTETEFLSIGSRLQDFHLHAKELSNMTASIVSLMSGEKMTGAIDGLGNILDRVKVLQNVSAQGKDLLEEILGILGRIQEPLGGFKKIVKSLGVLCVAIKMESARLGEDDPGFDALSGDIKKLSLEIEAKSNTILAQSTSLILPIQQTLAHVLDIEAVQRGEAAVILENTAANLTLLTQKHELASAAMRRMAQQYDAVTGSIGEVVGSLQFHDITRQRVEHVKSGLDELIPRLQGPRSGGNGCKPPEGLSEIRTAGDICELQSAQLRHAGDELAAAVENILENLRGIAGNVAGMSRTTREAIGITSDAGSSFGSEMERGLSPVASALSRYAAGNRQLTAAISSVLGTVGEMAAYVKDIESIEIQMRLIALNAIVKASRIDGNGAPLGVLAEEIHQLSFVTHQHVDIISVSLKSIMTTAEKLAAGIGTEAESGEAELDRMMRKLKDLLESLRRLNEDSVSALMRADVAGRNLADEIEAFAAEIAVHDEFARKIREVMSKLDAMVARSRALAPVEGDLDRAERLSALEARYTMHSERSIHQAVAAAATSGIPQAIMLPEHETGAGNDGETKETVEDDLGDNVELF